MPKLRVGLDIQSLQTASAKRGIGAYVRGMVAALVKQYGRKVTFVLITSGARRAHVPLDVRGILLDFGLEVEIRTWYSLEEHFRYPVPGEILSAEDRLWDHLIESASLDVYLICSPFEGFQDYCKIRRAPNPVKTGAIIYDFIPYFNRAQYLPERYSGFYFERLLQVSKLDFALTISKSVSNNLPHILGPRLPMDVIGAGGAEPNHKAAKVLKSANNLVVLGGADPRKNTAYIIQEFVKFASRHEGTTLSVIGDFSHKAISDLQEQVPKNARKRILFLGHISDDSLREILSKSQALLFASIEEGFGLPILDSASNEMALIAADSKTTREIVGENYPGLFPLVPGKLNEKLEEFFENPEINRLEYLSILHRKVDKYTWANVAKRVMKNLNKFAEKNGADLRNSGNYDVQAELEKLVPITCKLHSAKLFELSNSIQQNLNQMRKARLYVDVSEISNGDAKSGIQRVVREILAQLPYLVSEKYDVVPVAADYLSEGYKYSSYGGSTFMAKHKHLEGTPIALSPKDVFLGLDLQHHIVIRQAGFISHMRRVGVRVAFVLYDLLPVQFPEFWPSEHKLDWLHGVWLGSIAKSDLVLAISSSVNDDYAKWLEDNADPSSIPKTDWFHIGSDFKPTSQILGSAGKSSKVQHNSYLMVGTLEPRKGHLDALAAFEPYWQNGGTNSLCIVGKPGWLIETTAIRIAELQNLGYPLVWLDECSDQELLALYDSAIAVIAASHGEGFGLPIVEAAAKKIPIIARDISVFREVAPPETVFFKTHEDLAGIIQKISTGNLKLQAPSKSPAQITWQESTKQLVSRLVEHKLLKLE